MNLAVDPLEKWTWFVKKPQDVPHRGEQGMGIMAGRHFWWMLTKEQASMGEPRAWCWEYLNIPIIYIVHSKWACMCCSTMKQGNAKWSGCCRNPNTRRQDCCGSSKRWTQQNSRNDCWTTCEKRYRCSWTMVLRWWKQTPLSFSCKFLGACICSWVTTKKVCMLINWEWNW